MKKLRRAPVLLKVGNPFKLTGGVDARREALSDGTLRIMHALAELLPEEYRGVYASGRRDHE